MEDPSLGSSEKATQRPTAPAENEKTVGQSLAKIIGIFLFAVVVALLSLLSKRSRAKPLPQVTINTVSSHHNPFSSLRGPLIRQNFPDPCIIFHDGTTYAFATNNRRLYPDLVRVQIATSSDNNTWNVVEGLDALPIPAAWQTGRAVWAPDVKQLPSGEFLLYYTDSLKSDPNTHCIGAAASQQITGPYRPQEQPLVCPHGGAIDPAGFYDRLSGRRYLLYKFDGNSLGNGGLCRNSIPPIKSTSIMLQEVDPDDGVTFIDSSVELLDREAEDGPLIEAPSMFLSTEGVYFLFFSANCYTTPSYHTSYATSLNITGPYARASRPLLTSGDGLNIEGPGGMDVIHHSYATDEAEGLQEERIDEYGSDSRMVLFHGRMTPSNDPSMKKQSYLQNSMDARLPFVRGMYSGVATFKGQTVSLGGLEHKKPNEP